ncbi:MAG: GNAT family N-acetyltransferase [Flavobacteriales bacterium CG18_big_fil_WC_8_21_14_2_50_32_9]|nr:MAG: GNAT family N-acetyltransferase [Flavobacteriales bacterium CG18_big_fil_WC_8_21_14_2_50_32_9]PIZ06446.1 MAG: N-acetyltransferase [Flavobacteriales bacterium CG_4_10_14_0_8_um_filter_32_5]
MHPFPIITTKKLILRKIEENDIPTILELMKEKAISEVTLNIPFPYSENDARFWINMARKGFENKNQYIFGIEDTATNNFIGGIDLAIEPNFDRAEVGYWLGKPYWNKGYCSDALATIINFGFEQLNLNKIFGVHIFENPASGKVMQKCGMQKEGELIDHIKKGDTYFSYVQYGITKNLWKSYN